MTPIFVALQQGNIEIARLLISEGADVNAVMKT
jgi:ankyrin repeat protein